MILSCNCSFIERLSFMKTIVIASQKGGSGKTMLAAHLAVEAERAGDTWLIDTDRQATLSLWHERRKADTPSALMSHSPALRTAWQLLPPRTPHTVSSIPLQPSQTKTRRCWTWPTWCSFPSVPPRRIYGPLRNRRTGERRRQTLYLCHHPGKTTGVHHRSSRRRLIAAWPCRPGVCGRPGSVCRRHDRRQHRARSRCERPRGRGNRRVVA